jgi:hypothetical protein
MRKRGLVLEGGGAKGAYQFGCLLALAEHGIQVDAIAGTSVGALNGALVAYDRLAEGQEYWSQLRPGKVVAPRYRWLPVAFLSLLYLASARSNRSESLPPFNARNFRLTLGYFLSMMALVAFLPLMDRSVAASTEWGFWERIGFIGSIYGLILILWVSYWQLRKLRFSLFEPRPIQEMVSQTISGQEPRRPLYVTLTHQSVAFDPDQPRMFYGKRNDKMVWGAVEGEYNFPHYIEISSRAAVQREEALLASAALPLGIFPSVELDGTTYIDGGVADNLPVTPLISHEKCDELVVIAMRPWTEEGVKRHWQEVERRKALEQMSPDRARELYLAELARRGGDPRHASTFDPPVNLPLSEPDRWPSRLVLVCPDKPVGSFLTGTIRFTGRYARRLLKEGYEDATRAFERSGLTATSSEAV